MDKYNRFSLIVLEELKNDPYFYKQNNLLSYNIHKEGKIIDIITHSGKIQAVWDLRDLGAIKIHQEERLPNTNNYEFLLLINHSSFDAIYKKCLLEVTGNNLEEQERNNLNVKMKKALKPMIKTIIVTKNLGKKQKKLLLLLSDFNPKTTSEIKEKINTSDPKSLVKATNAKLSNTNFTIKSDRDNSSFNPNHYRLEYTPNLF